MSAVSVFFYGSHTADPACVERILAPARELGFPEWYRERLASFRSAGAAFHGVPRI